MPEGESKKTPVSSIAPQTSAEPRVWSEIASCPVLTPTTMALDSARVATAGWAATYQLVVAIRGR